MVGKTLLDKAGPTDTRTTGGQMIKRIHVNQLKIRSNKKHGTNEPVLAVRAGGRVAYGHQVVINGPSKLIYSPDKPLSCGARCWLETEVEVEIL